MKQTHQIPVTICSRELAPLNISQPAKHKSPTIQIHAPVRPLFQVRPDFDSPSVKGIILNIDKAASARTLIEHARPTVQSKVSEIKNKNNKMRIYNRIETRATSDFGLCAEALIIVHFVVCLG